MGKPRVSDMKRPISGRLRQQQEEQSRQRSTSPFFGTGFHPTSDGGIESDDFDGNHSAGDAGTTGWAFNSLRAAIGELFLRPGSVGNDALSNPTAFGFGGNSTTGFGVFTGATAKTAISIPIPAGYTRALVHCTANASAKNPNASLDYLYVAARIDLPSTLFGQGGEAFAGVETLAWGNASASAAGSYTDIGTGSITLSCMVRANSATWAAQPANIANIDGTVVFLR